MGLKSWRWPCSEETPIMKKSQVSLPLLKSLRLWAKKWWSFSFFKFPSLWRSSFCFPQEIALCYINSDLADDLKKLQQGMDGKSLILYSTLFFNDHPVASTKKVLSNLKFLRAQRGQINAEFFDVLQGLVDLDPTFAGMTNKISKIQGIWLMVSVHLAHLLACLIHPFSFIRLAVERLWSALKPTVQHEQHEVWSSEFLLLAAVRPPIHNSFKVFNQFATTLTLTYETLQFSLGRYSMAVSKST